MISGTEPMLKPGDVISYLQMCQGEGVNLQRGMNFRLNGGHSVILMSVRAGAPYADKVEENGKVLIYEGHDVSRTASGSRPKTVDQPVRNESGSLTQNGLFYQAAQKYQKTEALPEPVKVYEKIKAGIWVYNGLFSLIDSWQEEAGKRKVFKFRLECCEENSSSVREKRDLEHERLIPSAIKLEVWRRDKGRCVTCASKDNLHFDHIIPYSKGGSSLVAENIQILCARHNLEKSDKIR